MVPAIFQALCLIMPNIRQRIWLIVTHHWRNSGISPSGMNGTSVSSLESQLKSIKLNYVRKSFHKKKSFTHFGQISRFLGPTKLIHIPLQLIFYCSFFFYRISLRRKRKSKTKTKKAVWQLIIAMLPPKKSHKTPQKISQKKPQKFIQKNWLGINYFNSKMDKKWALVFRRVLAKKSTKFV